MIMRNYKPVEEIENELAETKIFEKCLVVQAQIYLSPRGQLKHFGLAAKASHSNKFGPRCLQAKASQESNQKMQSTTH